MNVSAFAAAPNARLMFSASIFSEIPSEVWRETILLKGFEADEFRP
jgi:hypothetical protein